MKGLGIFAVIAIVLALGATYALKSQIPTQAAIDEGEAYTRANNTMMASMMGDAVVYSGNPDDDFAMLMIPHHQGAVDMADVEVKYGKDTQIIDLARQISAAQIPQIQQMQTWRREHPKIAATPDGPAAKKGLSAANDKMMSGMMKDGMGHSGNADLDFVKMMIPHHQGAVDMGEVEVQFGKDAGLRALAQVIMERQKTEIAEMKTWLAAHK
jgi:uncharacterized protein (DUF305 family)